MKIKQITKILIAAALAVNVVAVPLAITENMPFVGIVASAAEAYKKVNGFVLSKDADGTIYVSDYDGKGGNITIPKEAKYIGYDAFKYNTSITSVTFPAGTTRYGVGESAFAWCTNLKSVTFKGDVGSGSYDGIYANAFMGCHQLKTVTFNKNSHLSYIDESAFFSCYALSKVTLPTDTLLIKDGAFQNCLSLTSITIPKKTKIEGNYTFGYMYGAKTTDDYYANLYNDDSKNMLDVKADGTKTVYWEICAKTESEADKLAKALFGNTAKMVFWAEDDGAGTITEIYDYSFCYPIKQRKIKLNVASGSAAETWAKSKKISYSTYSSASNSSAAVLDAPTNLDATKTKNSITLVWDEVPGASAYKVYIYNSNTGKYKAYKTVASEICKVTKLSAGTKYKFKVVALKKVDNKYKAGEYATISVTTKK